MWKFVALVICSLAFFGCLDRNAKAGWFGPSNYDECVLGKMKGQPSYLLSNARSACKVEFPGVVQLDRRQVKYHACDTGLTSLCVDSVPQGFKVSKVLILLSFKNPCVPVLSAYFDPDKVFMDTINHQDAQRVVDEQERDEIIRAHNADLATWSTQYGSKSYWSDIYSFENPEGRNCLDAEFEGNY